MKVTQTKIKDVIILEPESFSDERGWFSETYNEKKYRDAGVAISFIQDNHSFSIHKGTLRGLHVQNAPYAQSKLVRCTKGAVLDVAVDLRKNSPTYKEWVSVELTEKDTKQVLVPKGFAHGFLTLTDNAEVQYKVDAYHNQGSDRSIRFNDPDLAIAWGNPTPILSAKDSNAPFLKDSDINVD